MRRKIWTFLIGLVLALGDWLPLLAEEKPEVFPSAPYDRFIIFQSLAIFWVGIIGLIVIIRMRLREIERVQRLGVDREEDDVPLLE